MKKTAIKFLLFGEYKDFKIGVKKSELDQIFGFQPLGEYNEAVYLNYIECIFDSNLTCFRFIINVFDGMGDKVKYFNKLNSIPPMKEIEVIDLLYKNLVQFIVVVPCHNKIKMKTRDEFYIVTKNNVSIMFDYNFGTKDTSLGRISVDNGAAWKYQMESLMSSEKGFGPEKVK